MALGRNADFFEVSLCLWTILVVAITVALSWLLFAEQREMKRLHRKLLLIESVRLLDTQNKY